MVLNVGEVSKALTVVPDPPRSGLDSRKLVPLPLLKVTGVELADVNGLVLISHPTIVGVEPPLLLVVVQLPKPFSKFWLARTIGNGASADAVRSIVLPRQTDELLAVATTLTGEALISTETAADVLLQPVDVSVTTTV